MKKYITRKESIVLTAIDIIDSIGARGLTIKEISKRQDITEGAIYKHFKSKEEIILSIMDKFSYYDERIVNSIKNNKYSAKEGIAFIVKSYAEYYENYPEMTSLLFAYRMFTDESEADKKFNQIVNNRYSLINKYLEEQKTDGFICKEVDCENITCIILGTIKEIIYLWRLQDKKFNLKKRILETINIIVDRLIENGEI
jgi:AcrR family transcriptional regulator